MSGLLIYLANTYGGLDFLARLFYNLKKQPSTQNKKDREERANNLYRAAKQSCLDLYDVSVVNDIHDYFYNILRWKFIV